MGLRKSLEIVTVLRVLAGIFALTSGAIIVLRGERLLAVALLSASHAALLWAASSALHYLSRICEAIEWIALRTTASSESHTPPAA